MYVRAFISRIPVLGPAVYEFAVPLIIFVLVCLSFSRIKNSVRPADIGFVLIAMFFYFLTYLFFPANSESLDDYAQEFLLKSLPFYLAGIIFSWDDLVDDAIYYVSLASLAFLAFYFFFYIGSSDYSGSTEISNDMMGPSYSVLPNLLIIARRMLKKANVLNIAAFVLGLIMILSFGTRGPLVCLLAFFVGYLLFLKQYKRPVLSKSAIVLVAAVLYFYMDAILLLFMPITQSLGFDTRIYDLLLYNDSFLNDASGDERRSLFAESMKAISPAMHGIRGESVALSNYDYAHNIVLEFWIEYGTILGSILLMAIFYLIYKSIKVSGSDDSNKSFILVLVCSGLVRLFMSLTYLIVPSFFMLLGYCAHVIRESKYRDSEIVN